MSDDDGLSSVTRLMQDQALYINYLRGKISELEEQLKGFREADDKPNIARTLIALGTAYQHGRDRVAAYNYYSEAYPLAVQHLDVSQLASLELNMGTLLSDEGQYDLAVELIGYAILHYMLTNDVQQAAVCQAQQAIAYLHLAKWADAAEWLIAATKCFIEHDMGEHLNLSTYYFGEMLKTIEPDLAAGFRSQWLAAGLPLNLGEVETALPEPPAAPSTPAVPTEEIVEETPTEDNQRAVEDGVEAAIRLLERPAEKIDRNIFASIMAPFCTLLLAKNQVESAAKLSTHMVTSARSLNDTEALYTALLTQAAVLRHTHQMAAAAAAMEEAYGVNPGLASRAAFMVLLCETDQVERALALLGQVVADVRSASRQEILDNSQHLSFLLYTLKQRRQPATVLELAEAVSNRLKAWTQAGETLDAQAQTLYLVALTGLPAGGNLKDAEPQMRRLLEVVRQEGNQAYEVALLYELGQLQILQSKYDDAKQLLSTAGILSRQMGDEETCAQCYNRIGTLYTHLGANKLALSYLEQALSIHRTLQNKRGIALDLIQAIPAAAGEDDKEKLRAFRRELSGLDSAYHPADDEWVDAMLGFAAAHLAGWGEARTHFRTALTKIEQRRAVFSTAEEERSWCQQRANIYGGAIESAINAGEYEEAISYFELARNRYLNSKFGVNRLQQNSSDPYAFAHEVLPCLGPALLSDANAIVWCGLFASGLGIVAAWKQGEEIEISAGFHSSVTQREFAQLSDTTSPLAQETDPAWSAKLTDAMAMARDLVWTRILGILPESTDHITLMPSVGCSELPLAGSIPDQSVSITIRPSLSSRDLDNEGDMTGDVVQIENPAEDPAIACCSLECRAVGVLFERPVKRLRGRHAHVDAVLEAIADAEIVHFMGHASCNWFDPILSALHCAGATEGERKLTVAQLFEHTVRAKLVVLSACEIGNVETRDRQNDFINIPSTLLASGTRSVVAPRWTVDDVATSLLMAEFFRRILVDRVRAADALALAQRWLRDAVTIAHVLEWLDSGRTPFPERVGQLKKKLQTQPPEHRPFQSPEFWAGFELYGHPDPLEAIHD
jgi:tetratricopeptide (TPR) repeat protein